MNFKLETANIEKMCRMHAQIGINFIEVFSIKLSIWEYLRSQNAYNETIFKFLSNLEFYRFYLDTKDSLLEVLRN